MINQGSKPRGNILQARTADAWTGRGSRRGEHSHGFREFVEGLDAEASIAAAELELGDGTIELRR
jgi:hypothetical protein